MPKIIAVCPKEYPGVNSVFEHGAALGLWEHHNLVEELPENDLVILGAWHPYYLEYLDKYSCVVYLTSTFGQMEFSDNYLEIENVRKLLYWLRSNKIKALLAGSKDVSDYFQAVLGKNSFYAPYPFSIESIAKYSTAAKELNSIGVFLPFAPRKNTVNQLLAAAKSGMKIYTNLPWELDGIVKTGWLPKDKYLNLISGLMLTLHCTFTESFSYAAAESLVVGTLPIVSVQVCDNLNLTESLTCYQCDSVFEILRKIRKLKDLNNESYSYLLKKHIALFKFRNEANLKTLKDVLDKVTALVVK